MTSPGRFTPALVAAFATAKIIGVRAGTAHRFTGVWVVVVRGRVFARSWSDQETGWHRAFAAEPRGAIQLPSGRRVRVVARRARGDRVLDAIDAAYAEKYNTPASLKWVKGFREPRRRATTLELMPAAASPRTGHA